MNAYLPNFKPNATALTEATTAISIRQPFAWLILNAGKDVENRSWKTNYRGKVLIHAAKGMTRAEYGHAVFVAANVKPRIKDLITRLPSWDDIQRGGIVGEVEIIDCVTQSNSPWFTGKYGFVLRNAKPLPFMPCKGALGFFKVNYAEFVKQALQHLPE